MRYQQLDPLTVPLEGLRLIEASAGTGKTWVIAALYVRAVLGHGGQPARMPPEILVVTFTRDATAELRERIRGRLEEAVSAFRSGQSTDAFLLGLMADHADPVARSRAARQLEVAAQWMDEAAIFTIHAWAHRMLTRYAFDSGRSLGEAEEADQYAHVIEACRDYWRREVYALAPAHFDRLIAAFPAGPDSLGKALLSLLPKQLTAEIEGGAAPRDTLAETLGAAFGELEQALEAERRDWVGHLAALRVVQPALEDGLARSKAPGKHLSKVIAGLDGWVKGGELWLPTGDIGLLGEAALTGALKKGKTLPPCPAYAAAERLAAVLERAPCLKPVLLRHALRQLPAVIERAKAVRGEIGFDDMLSELDRALAGEQGASLAQSLRTQLPLALIDEFQDTDPLQWRIFERVYAGSGALLLIGDPKQSIYRFRGADIGTYFRARRAAAAPALTLPCNYRSTAPLVRAVNALFQRAEEVAAEGAFGFGKGEEGLRFDAVDAKGRPEQLIEDGAPAPSISFAVPADDAALNKGRYVELMAEAAAERVATWLAEDSSARIAKEGKPDRRVKPSDIAILVRTGSEAGAVRSALRRRRVASVYLSDKQSVFASAEAADLVLWLSALAEPGSDRALRAALASASVAFPLAEIERAGQDDLFRDELIDIFNAGNRLWRERGILAAVRHLIHALQLPARHASAIDAERCLTNLLHVAELLQHAAVHLDGEHALLRYLADAIARSDEPGADAAGATVQRLESDADLVRVITIHASKGLQYKLVVIPFPCSFRDLNPKKDTHFEFERNDTRIVSLEPTGEAVQGARLAGVREEVRLFYVAITRAELACWIGAAAVVDGVKNIHGAPLSGLGRLLGGGAELSGDKVREAITQLAQREASIRLVQMPAETPRTRVAAHAPLATLAPARMPEAPRAPAWWLSSYSALVRGPKHRGVDPGSAAEGTPLEEYAESRSPASTTDAERSIHGFPRGASYGSFLHYLLEWAAVTGFARVAAESERAGAEITRRTQAAGLADWAPMLQAWLPAFLTAPLALPDGRVVALTDLQPSRYRPEFAFMVEAHGVVISALDDAVTRHLFPGRMRPPLSQKFLNGLLSGFVDLVFEHDGAWYTLDYKSNHLADTAAGYTEEAMADAMAHHRYDLQAALYLLALHRFLRARLPEYNPARHIGGVLYPFLRGVGEGTGVLAMRPDVDLLDTLDALFAGGLKHVA